MFVKFQEPTTGKIYTVNTEHIVYISHFKYIKFTISKKQESILLDDLQFREKILRNYAFSYTDDYDNRIITFTTDLMKSNYIQIREFLSLNLKNIIIQESPIFKLQMSNGQTFYCDNTIYNIICNNNNDNDNLVI